MTKQARGQGDKVTRIAPTGGVVSGQGYIIGANEFMVAEGDAAVGESFVGVKVGIVSLPLNASDTATIGNMAWWDDTNKELLNVSTVGAFPIGVFNEARGAAAGQRVEVCLDGTSTTAA